MYSFQIIYRDLITWRAPGRRVAPALPAERHTFLHYHFQSLSALTHWGRVTHICVSNLTTIGSDNGLSPGRRQAIIWTNAGMLWIGPLGTNLSEIIIEILTFSFKKIHLKMSSGKWRPFCIGLNELNSRKHPASPLTNAFEVLWQDEIGSTSHALAAVIRETTCTALDIAHPLWLENEIKWWDLSEAAGDGIMIIWDDIQLTTLLR